MYISVDTVATLKQVEFIQDLTRRPFVGGLKFDEISERLGKDVWKLSKVEASELITQLSTRAGLDKFLEEKL